VQSLASVGNGCPDLLCAWGGPAAVLEVKVPGEQLNPVQKKWHREWGGKAHVVYSLAEAVEVMKTYRGK
jgi:hypothetical protein